MLHLSKKASLSIFWTFIALILLTTITSILTDWKALEYMMAGLFIAVLLFCTGQLFTLTERSSYKRTILSMVGSALVLFAAMIALSFVLNIYETVCETLTCNLFMSCMATVIDCWYNTLCKHNPQ